MGCGKAWTADENELLARAWILKSEDPVVGTDQTRKVFVDTAWSRFIELGPKNVIGRFADRTSASVIQHFQDLSADVQKFRCALRTVLASNPTGVNDDNIHSMAAAIHLGKTPKMYYIFKDFNCMDWLGYKAWMLMWKHPKWADPPTVSETSNANSQTGAEEDDCEGDSASSSRRNGIDNGTDEENRSKNNNRYPVGMKQAKAAKQEELRTQAVRSMAESAKRKSDCLEERNAIEVFSRPEARDLDETKQFFEHMRDLHLVRIANGARTEQLTDNEQARDIETVSPTSTSTAITSAATPNPSNGSVTGNPSGASSPS